MMTDAEMIERFEETTGLTFDHEGPGVIGCEHCGGLLQFVPDHDCCGSRCLDSEVSRYDE
jgi:hypothetical protein